MPNEPAVETAKKKKPAQEKPARSSAAAKRQTEPAITPSDARKRGWCYILQAGLGMAMAISQVHFPETSKQWAVSAVLCGLAMLMAWRIYVDQSVSMSKSGETDTPAVLELLYAFAEVVTRAGGHAAASPPTPPGKKAKPAALLQETVKAGLREAVKDARVEIQEGATRGARNEQEPPESTPQKSP